MDMSVFLRKASQYMLAGALLSLTFHGSSALAQLADPQTSNSRTSGTQQSRNPEDQWILDQKKKCRKGKTSSASTTSRRTPTSYSNWPPELKQYVDKTNENIISLDVIKKAEAVEDPPKP